MSPHDETLLETGCAACLIRVSAWGGEDSAVYVSVFSNHLPVERWRWRGRNGRLRTAWRVLRHGWRDPELEFDDQGQLDAFRDALARAHDVAFASVEVAKP